MGLGYLHGYRPQDFKKSTIIAPQKFLILTTEESLFTPEVKQKLSEELHLEIEVRVSRNWNDWLVNLISNASADLLILPSYWSNTFQQQELLTSLNDTAPELLTRVSPDFLKARDHMPGAQIQFMPLYWLKTAFISSNTAIKTFPDFAKDKNAQNLYLWFDEDILLRHFQVWRDQGQWENVKTKKILTMSLEDIQRRIADYNGVLESPVAAAENNQLAGGQGLNSLVIWGLAIPKNALHFSLSLAVVKSLSETTYQEKLIPNTIFSSALKDVGEKTLPLTKRAAYVRDLNLNETLILESKDIEAKRKLRDSFDFNL